MPTQTADLILSTQIEVTLAMVNFKSILFIFPILINAFDDISN